MTIDYSGWRDVTEVIDTSASFSTSTTSHEFTCPAGKQQLVTQIMTKRDANETMIVYHKNSLDEIIALIESQAAATTRLIKPSNTAVENISFAWPILLVPGDYIHYEFGGAQGAGAEIVTRAFERSI